jgi:hypothetical protein
MTIATGPDGSRPRLLDLFCGAGGASVGYHRAGFDVTGVDNKPHPDYPFEILIDDAMTVVKDRDYLDTVRRRRRFTALPPLLPHHPRHDP